MLSASKKLVHASRVLASLIGAQPRGGQWARCASDEVATSPTGELDESSSLVVVGATCRVAGAAAQT